MPTAARSRIAARGPGICGPEEIVINLAQIIRVSEAIIGGIIQQVANNVGAGLAAQECDHRASIEHEVHRDRLSDLNFTTLFRGEFGAACRNVCVLSTDGVDACTL